MEEKKNNAVEKVENAIDNNQTTMDNQTTETITSSNENVLALRERRKIERAKLSAIRLREKTRRRERALIEKSEREKRDHMLKQQKLNAQKERRERNDAERRKEREKNRGRGGYVAAIISLGIATLVLSSVLTFTFLMPTENDNTLEASYQKSFYDTVEQVSNIDLNLSKLIVSKDRSTIQGYLLDLTVNSELAENNIQQLPLQDQNKYYTSKLINQIGDYAKYLSKKLAEGESLSSEDKQNLTRLYSANASLKDTLYKSYSNMDENFSFSSMNDEEDNAFILNMNELEYLSVEYPELIYDGPFSDGLKNREIKGLPISEVNEAYAKDEFIKIFGDYGLTDVKSEGLTQGQIECLNFSAEVNGENLYAQFSKRGGKLIMFAFQGSCEEVKYLEEEAREKAVEFITQLGLVEMKPVWCNLSNNVYTFNFAYEQNGVIIYSDLVKVRVCAQTNMVIGLEASTYYTNHTERFIGAPTLTEKKAKTYVSDDIQTLNSRLVLIPIGNNSEKLCYEFEGEYNNSTYYVYIDAINGRQVEMFKVIESTEGKLLM